MDDTSTDLDLSAFNELAAERGFSVQPTPRGDGARLIFSAASWPEPAQADIYDYLRSAWPLSPDGWTPAGGFEVETCDEGLFVDYAPIT